MYCTVAYYGDPQTSCFLLLFYKVFYLRPRERPGWGATPVRGTFVLLRAACYGRGGTSVCPLVMESYKRKRLATLQQEIDTINDDSHPVLRKKIIKADRDRTDKLARASRRRDCTLEVAELGTQKEMDDIRDWWKVEAKRVKDELYAKICDSVGAHSHAFHCRRTHAAPFRLSALADRVLRDATPLLQMCSSVS
jgi:hypothetical protein